MTLDRGPAGAPANAVFYSKFALFKLPSVVTVSLTCIDCSPDPTGPGSTAGFE
jgi:hypothetical protein